MKTLLSQVIDTSQEQKQEQKTVQKQSTTYKKDVPRIKDGKDCITINNLGASLKA